MSATVSKALVGKPGEGVGTGRASDDYKKDFWNALRGMPAVHNALAVGSDPLGGYLVPQDFERTLVESLEEYNHERTENPGRRRQGQRGLGGRSRRHPNQ
jgi:HK97 family phage major capsid protein